MSNRSWFFASEGKQQGPCPEAQLREFIARGMVTAETLVWSEGMAGWQKAGEIPGLMSSASGPPPDLQQGAGWASASGPVEPLSIEPGLWALLGRNLLYVIGLLLVIPAPWTSTGFCRWMVSRLRVPGRPNLAFTGQVGDIWYVFVLLGLLSYAGYSGVDYLEYITVPIDGFLSWVVVRWIAANFSSNGQRLPISFKGSAPGYVGWYVLLPLSVITIIGWAWVATAWMRWNCRHVIGTRREIVFTATGWDVLWRGVVFTLGSALLIPLPWTLRWFTRWVVSQFALAERTATPTA
jgi:GYF domain 2